MSRSVIRKDTYECFLQNISSEKWYYIGLTTKGSTSTKINQDKIRAGIGAPVVAIINSQKEITIEVNTGIHYGCASEIQNGAEFQSGSAVIPRNGVVNIVSNKFTLAGTDVPMSNQVIVEDVNGTQVIGTFSSSDRSVTTVGLADGSATIIYQITVADVQTLDISSTAFPQNMRMWMHSITYDKKTGKKVEDIYKIYYNVVADGADEDSGEVGKNSADTIKFDALADEDHDNNMGKIVVIPVKSSATSTAPTVSADTTPAIGTDIILTFTDDATWRGAITEVLVNSVTIPISDVTLASGTLTINKALFPTVGIYNVVIVAKGYNTVSLNQTIVSA